jgi:hypothetical protein
LKKQSSSSQNNHPTPVRGTKSKLYILHFSSCYNGRNKIAHYFSQRSSIVTVEVDLDRMGDSAAS